MSSAGVLRAAPTWSPAAPAAPAPAEQRETPAARAQALRLMRDWIAANEDIRDVRVDDSFLLRFLRHRKFRVPLAQQTLLKYLGLRRHYPQGFERLDCRDPALAEIVEMGYIAVSPVRDNHGRRVIIYNMGKFDAGRFTCWQLCRAHALLYESLLEEEAAGFTHVGDGGGAGAAHVAMWRPADLARLVKWGEQSLPMSHKECHLVNIHPTIKYALDFAVSKVSPKMAARLHVHSSVQKLRQHVPAACLPQAYGGAVTAPELLQHTRRVLAERRDAVMALDRMAILNTRGILSARAAAADAMHGSFRKLEID